MERSLLYNTPNQQNLHTDIVYYFNNTLKRLLNANTVIKLYKQGFLLSHNKELTNVTVTKFISQLLEDPLHSSYLTSQDKFDVIRILELKYTLIDCFAEISQTPNNNSKKWWKCW